jgi:hypothetical protein
MMVRPTGVEPVNETSRNVGVLGDQAAKGEG